MNTCKSLPTELLIIIFGHLDSSKAIGECRLVCKAWDEPAAISMLRKPIDIDDFYLACDFVEYLESHPNKGQTIRHLTIYDYGRILERFLQQTFTPNIEELDVGGYAFTGSRSLDVLYDLITDIAKNSHVKFGKLKKIPYFANGNYSGAPSDSYKKTLWTFRESLQFVKLNFLLLTEVQDLIYRLADFNKLTSLALRGRFGNLTVVEAILKGCPYLKKLVLTVNDFVVWEGQQWDDDNQLDPGEMLEWAKENVMQVNSMEALDVSCMGYPNFFEYLMYKYPNITKLVFDTFRQETAYENNDDLVSKNIVRIVDTVKHLKTFELHYQIPAEQRLEHVGRAAQGDLNSVLVRYNELGGKDTMHMHLTSTLLADGTRSALFDVEIPNVIEHFSQAAVLKELDISIHSVELDFLNYTYSKEFLSYKEQLPMTEQSAVLFTVLYCLLEIKQIKVLANLIDEPIDVFNFEEGDSLLESLEFCSARVTQDALESIGQDCQRLNTLILTNCLLVPDDRKMYHIKMHSVSFDKLKLCTVPENALVREAHGCMFGREYPHVEKFVHEVLKSVKKTWSKPCYLWLAVSSANKKVHFEIIPGKRSTSLITKEAFDARDKGSYVLHLNCKSIKSLEIDIGESYLSLDQQAIAAALNSRLSCVLEEDDMEEEDDEDDDDDEDEDTDDEDEGIKEGEDEKANLGRLASRILETLEEFDIDHEGDGEEDEDEDERNDEGESKEEIVDTLPKLKSFLLKTLEQVDTEEGGEQD